MSDDADQTETITARVREAATAGTPLAIQGGGSKPFYGHPVRGEPLDVTGHRGVLNYEPTELMLTARAGTPLAELEEMLAANGQMLAFEPPRFDGAATLGGVVAAGLSGPRRPFAGAVRDHVLGVRIVDGNGTVGRFGGEVIKNVAGYDVSRLSVGALGTLGVVLEVSIKVLPRPEAEGTVCLDMPTDALYGRVEAALRDGAPITAAAHDGERAWIRLAGAASAVTAGASGLGGDTPDDGTFWKALRDQTMEFFRRDAAEPLWRLSLPPGGRAPAVPGHRIVDWGGQLHWVRTDAPADRIREATTAIGGHATLFRGGNADTPVFTPLQPVLA
ncbi:MAG: glycolate oxidase subunit GlcE, partial [Halofilum sp. (in: g-proteobacteria)]